jgi:hypothetical protein
VFIRYQKWIVSTIQSALVAIYFPVYNWSVVGGFIYASFFALTAPFLLKRILIDHVGDWRFIFLLFISFSLTLSLKEAKILAVFFTSQL